MNDAAGGPVGGRARNRPGGWVTGLLTGLGTSLALGATGLASTAFGWRLGRWSNRLAGASIMFAGALLIWMGVAPSASMHHHAHC